MKKNRLYIKPRIFRILGYLFWLACMLVMYIMFRSFLLLFFTSFLAAVPVFSIVAAVFPARRIEVSVRTAVAGSTRKGDELMPVLELRNPLYIGSSDAVIDIGVRNIFLSKNESELKASLPVVARKPWRRAENYGISKLMVPFVAEKIGDYSFSVKDVQVGDLLGLIRIGIRCGEIDADISVLPKKTVGEMPDSESISSGMTEVEESSRTGNDFSEVTDIREYQPGDRIRDIHWKLSARQEEWMVKIRTQMAGMELSVVMALDPDAEVSEQIVEKTYGELKTWAAGETDIRLLVYNAVSYGFDSFILLNPDDVDKAFEEILRMNHSMRIPADSSTVGLDGIIGNLFPYMGGYILFGRIEDGSIDWCGVEGMRV